MDLDDVLLDMVQKAVHPVPPAQDGGCPHIKWLGEDLVHCPGIGEWKCMQQQYEYGEYGYGGNFDYRECNAANHNTCLVYLAAQKKER